MPDRLEVTKTYKLFIDGKFPRSESGRTLPVEDAKGRVLAHVCRGSRKDLRDAVTAARKALDGWRGATAYLRGQILYRMAEMMEGKREELAEAVAVNPGKSVGSKRGIKSSRHQGIKGAAGEVAAAIDRLIGFAGWSDKYAQLLGCNNAVAGPYYNFTVPEPTGVVAVVASDEPALLGLVTLMAAPLCAGNTVVALSGESAAARLATVILAEVIATSDVPPGVVNLLTGLREELVPVIAGHRDIDGVSGAGLRPADAATLREGIAENLKRVRIGDVADWYDPAECETPWRIEPFVEMKTIWHPSAV